MTGSAALALCLGSLLSVLFVYRFVKFVKSKERHESYAFVTLLVGVWSGLCWLYVSDYATGVLMVVFIVLALISLFAALVHIAILD